MTNAYTPVQIHVQSNTGNTTTLSIAGDDTTQKTISKGTYDVLVNSLVVLPEFKFQAGAVYTIIIHQSENGSYVSNFKEKTILFGLTVCLNAYTKINNAQYMLL